MVEGGSVRIVIISVAACLKKSSIFTFGKGITFVKKGTASSCLYMLVLGK